MADSQDIRILLVDREPAVCDWLGEALAGLGSMWPELAGVEVDQAASVSSALDSVRLAIGQRRPYGLAVVGGTAAAEGAELICALGEIDSTMAVLVCGSVNPWSAEGPRPEGRFWLPWPPEADVLRQMVALLAERRHLRGALARHASDLGAAERALACARQEVAEAARAKGEFMANLSHEIRTPMNAIIGFTGLLMKEPISDAQREKLLYIQKAGETLLHVVTHVLDFSKLATGDVRLQPTVFDVDDAIRETIEGFRTAVSSKGLTLRCHIEEAVPPRLQGDKGRFRQILSNLLDNAVKFTQKGAIHVRATLDEETEKTASLRVTVTDTGVGIPADRQGVVFESFCQADGSSTRRFDGVGVGLAICRRLVSLMGGQVGLQSTPGQGSMFWFTATLRKPPPADAAPASPRRTRTTLVSTAEAPADAPDHPIARRPHILVADDDPMSRVLLEMLLGRVGCVVETVANGRDAVSAFQSHLYDLVFMDLDMPEMDGLEATRLARQHEATTGAHVPIVALTAIAGPADRQACLDAGVDRYLTKPCDPDELLRLTREHFPWAFETEARSTAECGRSTAAVPPGEEQVEAMSRALQAADFGGLEEQARVVREQARQAGWQPVADEAMRVQLAARSGDRARTDEALEQLRKAIGQQAQVVY